MLGKMRRCIKFMFAISLFFLFSNVIIINGTTTEWQVEIHPDNPLDQVAFEVKDYYDGNAVYYVGYRNGKVAIANADYELVAQTEYELAEAEYTKEEELWTTHVRILDGSYWENNANTYYQGRLALIVRKNGYYGMCDLQGKEIFPCEYPDIWYGENYKGHGVYKLTKKDGTSEMWIDGKVKNNQMKNPFFKEYNGEICLWDYNLDSNERFYTCYDLKGNKAGTVPAGETENSYGIWDVSCFKQAQEEWLSEKCTKAETDVKNYFEGQGYIVESLSARTGYNYVKDRENKMFYYVIVRSELSIKGKDGYTQRLGQINYIYVYKEDKSLYLEGQTNLSAQDARTDQAVMQDVFVLEQTGAVKCMNRYTGVVREIYTTSPLALFCEDSLVTEKYFEENGLVGIVESKQYTSDYTEEYIDDTRTYQLEYSVHYLYSFGKEKKYQILTTGETFTYDWHACPSLFGVAEGEKKTGLYYVADKVRKVDCAEGTVAEPGQFFGQYAQNGTNLIWINIVESKVHFINDTQYNSWDFETIGMSIPGCQVKRQEMFDDVWMVCIDEWSYDYENNVSKDVYFTLIIDTKTGNTKMLEPAQQLHGLLQGEGFDYTLSMGNIFYIYKNNVLYTLDKQNLTIQEKDFSELFSEETGAVSREIEAINGKPYIRYYIPRDENTRYYGYMNIQGTVVMDPMYVKVYEGDPHCIQYGEYFIMGDVLLDLNFKIVSGNTYTKIMELYDDKKGCYMSNGLVSIYNRAGGDQFIGFLYDSKQNKILKQFESMEKVYSEVLQFGDFYVFRTLKTREAVVFDIKAEKEIASGAGYCYMDEEFKRFFVFEKKEDSKDTVIQSGCTYTVDGSLYQIVNKEKRTVRLIYGARRQKTLKIPSDISIGGKKFKVIKVDAGACAGCTDIRKVVLGKYITGVGKEAFKNCKNLKQVVIQGKEIKEVGKNALKGTNKKLTIHSPAKMKKKYKGLWKNKGNAKVLFK